MGKWAETPHQLRQGLYADWLSKVKQYLAAEERGLEQCLTEVSCDTVHDFRERSAEVAEIILSFVPWRLRARIAAKDRSNLPRLLATLKAAAGPFNLFGLPRELRDNVYEYIPEFQETDVFVFQKDRTGRSARRALPAITRASSQLRKETRVIFMKRTTFAFTCHMGDMKAPSRSYANRSHAPGRILLSWFRDVIGEDAEHLRSIRVRIQFPSFPFFPIVACCVQYNDSTGLSCYHEDIVCWPQEGGNHATFKKKLRQRVVAVEKAAGAKKGEAIIKVLLDDPNLWKMQDSQKR